MTWNEAMKMACEVAGGRSNDLNEDHFLPGGQDIWWHFGSEYSYQASDPALPAYVAELLVARCWSVSDEYLGALAALEPPNACVDPEEWCGLAEFRYRILAALVALGKMTIEDAQGVE